MRSLSWDSSIGLTASIVDVVARYTLLTKLTDSVADFCSTDGYFLSSEYSKMS